MMRHPVISCDDHLDMNQLPADLFETYLPEKFKDRAPRVEVKDGRACGCAKARIGATGRACRRNGPAPSRFSRRSIAAASRIPASAALPWPSCAWPTWIATKSMPMSSSGRSTSFNTPDQALTDACYAAYNSWLKDFCSANPQRLIGVALLPTNPESAVKELAHIVELGGFKQANLQIAVAEPRLEDPRWEPLFDLLEKSNIALSFHVTVFPGAVKAFDKYKGSPGATFLHVKMFVDQFLDPFVDLFAWGILERHPGLKVVIAESGIGWLPWVVEELDYRHFRLWEAEEFWNERGGIPHKMLPSELFKRQVYGTFQNNPTAVALKDFYGENNLLWASDYPHPDSVWPNSRKTIDEFTKGADPEFVRRITWDNAAKLYGIELPAEYQAIAAE